MYVHKLTVCKTAKLKSYPADNSSSNITVSMSRACTALLISATFPDPMYVLGFGVASLIKFQKNKFS